MYCFRTSEVKGSPYLRISLYTSLCIVSGPVRLKVHRIYGSVCMLQILFGLLMVICGLIAIAIRESDGSAGTPYFIFAFVSGILVCIAHFTHPYFH